MDVLIQTITKDNASLLEAVAEDVFDEAIDLNYLAGYLEESNHILCVAVVNGLVVGQVRAIIHKHPDNPAELYIDNAGVAPAYQRQGIAKQLVTEIARLGQQRGCMDIWVGTESDNESAQALYQSFGLDMTDMVMFDGEL
jgi:ribosomal protein S18 acetylase RimI-like enzyme